MNQDVGTHKGLEMVTRAYRRVLEAAFILLPIAIALYLHQYQSPPLILHDHLFHEVAIAVSIVLSLFAAWVAFRCYERSGDPSLRFIALAFLGFAVVYAPHGVLTRMADHNLWLFILFGPASRVVMAAFLLTALLRHGQPPEPVGMRRAANRWLPWVAVMILVNVAVVPLAYSPLAGLYATRLVIEGTAILLCLGGAVIIGRRRLGSRAKALILVALLAFAQSSVAFLITGAWTHLWWLAHAIFAGGFFLLSYGLVRAYESTGSFSTVYSEDEMIARLAASEAATQAFRKAEARLRTLFDTSPVGICVTRPDGHILFCNHRQSQMLGLAATEGADERAFYADPAIRDRAAAAALASGEPVSAEVECVRADGPSLWTATTWTVTDHDCETRLVVWSADITQSRLAAEALAQAKEAAELANRAKTEFLAAMSHELRTPLNAVNGFAEAILAEILGPIGHDRYKEYCKHILDSGRHLTALINDVLDVAKIEVGREELDEEPVDVTRLIEATLIMVGDRARTGGLTISSDLPVGLPEISVDARRIKQVLINIVGNAVKFTPRGGAIVVRARQCADGGIDIAVTDTGIGISLADQPKALSSFGQVDSCLARRHDGMGLGLPLSRRLMETHGGSLELDSAPGRGTTVTLHFPATRLIALPAAAAQS